MRQDVAARKPFVLAAVSDQKRAFTQHTLVSRFSHSFKIIIVKKRQNIQLQISRKRKESHFLFPKSVRCKKSKHFHSRYEFSKTQWCLNLFHLSLFRTGLIFRGKGGGGGLGGGGKETHKYFNISLEFFLLISISVLTPLL